MSTVKTAISIDKHLFDAVEEFAHRLHLSRSQVFSQAIRNLVERKQNLELLSKLDEAYGGGQDGELARTAAYRKKQARTTRDTW